MEFKYNKGEWSEFYVFLHTLASGKLYAADSSMNKVPNVYYKILSSIRRDIEYNRDSSTNQIIFEYENTQITIPISTFESMEEILIEKIQLGTGTFSIPEINSIIEQLKINSIKERSDTKGDIILKIHDDVTGFEPTLSFSIKSYLGNKPTLLNASNGTVLKYQLSAPISENEMNRINSLSGSSKIKNRISAIRDLGIDLLYKDVPSTIFKENLQMIDYRLPEIISQIFLESYFVRGKKVSEVVQSFLDYNPTENPRIIKYKVQEFLVAIALGMVPLTEWTGLDEANGGYIVVKENAEVLCYHIYDRNRLKEYLYNHTKFDTPSTGRTSAGLLVHNEGGELEFSLTMQIRF
ncbi:HpaII family restriction endonuclease [Radiobacillus deserti]|uniref:HpaII family restriction endonuclease n=1 Tax=Radiobacillus deserti TaxID=2594883 RepID=A0A516KKQ7_9BACI|nr:HpaII family restriction endonuclease [Radiobacillus deserti]QDP41977.1 HpaII family restriction endonuclease [Radiobacillus deserti]